MVAENDMPFFVFAWILFLSLIVNSCDGMQLRKHDQRITEPTQEESILVAADLNTETATEHSTNTTKGCGQGTMTCLNFASDNTDLPVRCGTLTNVPLCPNNEPQEACNTFCDSDG
ncbi:hypothetical protein BCR42DRAFT_412264 [Absidia repens]|uniref:Secreted protein n=1 Tax=Absidia repens TaxID=90262 RepID=A0A1X2IJB7_9FUNG|nr:hypothetical protein BCR42DRAFT_412264 [Absidia repens]